MYKDKAAQKEATRERVRRYREKNSTRVTPIVTPIVTPTRVTPRDNVTPKPKNVTPYVTPILPTEPGWADVQAFILRDSPRMGNLERLQRIAGSLGKYADDVMYGISGLTMLDIGEVIGTQPALYPVS